MKQEYKQIGEIVCWRCGKIEKNRMVGCCIRCYNYLYVTAGNIYRFGSAISKWWGSKKGTKFSSEHRKNMSEAIKGIKHTYETKKKIRENWSKDHPNNNETIKKVFASRYGFRWFMNYVECEAVEKNKKQYEHGLKRSWNTLCKPEYSSFRWFWNFIESDTHLTPQRNKCSTPQKTGKNFRWFWNLIEVGQHKYQTDKNKEDPQYDRAKQNRIGFESTKRFVCNCGHVFLDWASVTDPILCYRCEEAEGFGVIENAVIYGYPTLQNYRSNEQT